MRIATGAILAWLLSSSLMGGVLANTKQCSKVLECAANEKTDGSPDARPAKCTTPITIIPKSPTPPTTSQPSTSPTKSPTASPSKSPIVGQTQSPTASPSKSPTGGTTTTSCPYNEYSTGTTVWTWTGGSEVPLTGKNIDVGDGPFTYTTVTKQGKDVPIFGTAGKTATVKMGCGADVDGDGALEGAGVMCQGFTVGQSGKNSCSGTPKNELLGDPGDYPDDTRFYCAIGGDKSKIACFQLKSSATSMSTVQIQVGCDESYVKSDGCWDNYVEVGLTVWDYKAAPGAMVTYYDDGYTTGTHTFTTYESKSLSHIGACVTEVACPGGGTTTVTSTTASPTASPTKSPQVGATASPTSSPTASPTVSPTKSPQVGATTSPSVSPTSSPTKSPVDGPTNPTTCPYTAYADGTTVTTYTSGSTVPIIGKGIDEGVTYADSGSGFKFTPGTAGNAAPSDKACGADLDGDGDLEGAGIMCMGYSTGTYYNNCTGTLHNELIDSVKEGHDYPVDTRFYCAVGGDESKIACFQLLSNTGDKTMDTVTMQVGCDADLVAKDGCSANIVEVGLTVWDHKASNKATVTTFGDRGYTTRTHTYITPENKDLSHASACVTEVACPGGANCPCTCGAIQTKTGTSASWEYPGTPSDSLYDSAKDDDDYPWKEPKTTTTGTYMCDGLIQQSKKPRLAIPCDKDEVYVMAVDAQSPTSTSTVNNQALTVAKLSGGEWEYVPPKHRYVRYEDSTRLIEYTTSTDWQNYDLAYGHGSVCMIFCSITKQPGGDDDYAPVVMCYDETLQYWKELGKSNRIGKDTANGDLELYMPSGCDCPEMSNLYFAIVGRVDSAHLSTDVGNSAVVWYYDKTKDSDGWQPLGGDSINAAILRFQEEGKDPAPSQSKDAHFAIPGAGNFKCIPHAVVSDNEGLDTSKGGAPFENDKHLVFNRFVPGPKTASDPWGFLGGEWKALHEIGKDTYSQYKESANDFVFTDSGVPVIAWSDNDPKKVYVSAWLDYPNAGADDIKGFKEYGGAMEPRDKMNQVEGVTIDSYGEWVMVDVTDNSNEVDSNNNKNFIGYIDISQGTSASWSEYNSDARLPEDLSSCGDSQEEDGLADAQNHIKIGCDGSVWVAHLSEKGTTPQNIVRVAKDGLPSAMV